LAASVVIVISMAAATSISLLLYLTDIAKGLNDNDALAGLREQLIEADGGDPQTILIIGSDKRLGPEGQGDPGRSDTTILLRVDPDKDAIALLSIPRDLKVNIPGYGVAKFNEAYTVGQEDKTLKTVTQLLDIEINHVVNINFTGFADAVDAIGCVYIDVDRRYFIPPESGISEIDIEAGYQILCGNKALQYVRFRHEDNDLVRSARQQDFLREARQKLPPEVLVRDRNELLDIFTEYTTSDISDAVPLLELLKTFAAVQDAPVSEVHFPAELGTSYVTAGEGAIQEAVEQFLNSTGTPGARPGGDSQDRNEADNKPRADKPENGADKPEQDFVGPPMDDSTAMGEQYAAKVAKEKKKDGDPYVEFPVYYPTRLAPGSSINDASRAFNIDGPGNDVYYGYKLAVGVPGEAFGNGLLEEYYGVSGTDWIDAPILDNPSETRTIDGRAYQLFYDGDRLRLVGFKTNDAAYWVNNSLSQSLDEGQMLSIATSMREFGAN
jgi:LCP family protein required for cell wall assembly